MLGLTLEKKNEDGTVTTTNLLKAEEKVTPMPLANSDGNSSGLIVSAAVSPMLAAASNETYWQEITDTSELTTDGVYMIVSKIHNTALTLNGTAVGATAVDLAPVIGHDGYYSSNLDNTSWWTLGANGATSAQYNVSNNSYKIYLSSGSSVVNTRTSNINNTFAYADNAWTLSRATTTQTYYLKNTGNNFSSSAGDSDNQLLIYKQTSNPGDSGGGDTPGGDTPGSIVVKPDYPAYITPSGEKHGETALDEVPGQYWSDPATSQLENDRWFSGRASDDGKVLTDKSVIYGDDDYNAFSSYEPNTFGVALSALGQKYALTEELHVPVPLDVVFVLDTSGSMINTTNHGVTSANIMVESLNNVMKSVLDDNEDNRVGVVCFSGSSEKILDLGRYTATNDKYFPEGIYTSNTTAFTPSSSLRRTDGALDAGTFNAGWYGTFTQEGIATGAQVFMDHEDTAITRTVTKETDEGTLTATYTANRRPIFILLSDGEPTYCTEDYNNVLATTNIHGNGNTGYNNSGTKIAEASNNNKGILGYYTILSAQYYKDQIAAHYNTDAYFYTIGIGIDETGNDSFENSVAGDDYKRATLNPTPSNISHLANCTNGKTLSSAITSANNDISSMTNATCHMLYQLLNNSYSGTSVTIGNHTAAQATQYGVRRTPTTSVPVKNNPYRASGYQYTDGAFFSGDTSVEQLTQNFHDAISFSESLPVYGFILKSNTPITLSDTIGEGMEVKSDLVLRVGGINHNPTSVTTDGNTKTYHYSGIYEATDGSGLTIDMNQIYAEVVKENGKETVRLVVPDSQIPAYSPNLKNDGSSNFYYESLPVRLLYQVGLTAESENEIIAMNGSGQSRTFYTNEWSDNDYSFASFSPTSKNPYYRGNTYDKSPLTKSTNTTSTKSNAWSFSSSSNAQNVGELLGNNGKLVFQAEKFTRVPFTVYKVDEDGAPITTDTATFEIYTDAALTNLVGEYSTDETGSFTIEGLRTNRTYYIKETKAPFGYVLQNAVRSFTLDEDGNVTSLNPSNNIYFTLDDNNNLIVRNDYDTTQIAVEKRWVGELGAGESYPTSAQVQLMADGSPIRSAVTLRSSNSWKYTWTDLPMISSTDKHVIAYTVEELNLPSGYVLNTETDENGNVVLNNQKQSYTSLSVVKKWSGSSEDSVQVELLANGKQTGNYATLSDDNDWYHIWEDLPEYSEEGALTYSVREIPMEGYSGEVHHWTGTGDTFGLTPVETRTRSTSFENGTRYLLTVTNNGNTYALSANTAGTQLQMVAYNENTEVTDRMLWTTTGTNTKTFTNVAANKYLVLNTSNQVALATSGRNTAWTPSVSSNAIRLSTTYGTSTRYYSAATLSSSGTGSTTTTRNNAVLITPYAYTYSMPADDGTTKGDEHYIVLNTNETPPADISLSFNKVSDEDNTVKLSGAEFALYRETGDTDDTLIPATADRYGVFVTDWETDGDAETITIDQNGVYYLVETQAPERYEPLTHPIVFEVTTTGGRRTASVVYHPSLESGITFTTMDIPNTMMKAFKMPSTGGMGTAWIYAFGGILMTAAAYIFIRRSIRFRREEQY